jgi:ADP-ribose pyrophosphatase YjhB (NUDIX family)
MINKKYKNSTWIIIKNKLWEVLFLKRKSNWLWSFAWWKTEEWEDSLECAKRELAEETGIKNIDLDFYTYTISFTNWIYWKETSYIWYIDNNNVAKNLETDVFSELRFFNINKIPDLSEIETYDHDLIAMLKWKMERNKSFEGLI